MSFINVGQLLNRNHEAEKNQILQDLRNIVRHCKDKYANKTELATENDSKILRLFDGWEILLFHGLKTIIFKSSATFWDVASLHLTRHEQERFRSLRHVHTDRGKFRALLRAALNERSLERYVLMWLSEETLYEKYEPYACILDRHITEELPKLAKSLVDILFALTVDAPDLDLDRKLNIMEKEEPIIPVASPKNLETHKRRSGVLRHIIDFEEISNSSPNQSKLESGPSHNILLIDENGTVTVENNTKGLIEEQLMFAFEQATSMDSSFHSKSSIHKTVMNTSISSFDKKFILEESVPNVTEGLEVKEDSVLSSKGSSVNSGSQESLHMFDDNNDIEILRKKLKEKEERCLHLENQVAELSLENARLRMLSSISRNTKIFFTVSIPSASLETNASNGKKYYAYKILVTPANDLYEPWTIKRRYSEFYELHKKLSKNDHSVKALDFPPKKKTIFGNRDAGFVEQRRQRLQVYLKHLVTILPEISECCSRSELTRTFPFLDSTVKYS